jgi:hypothetical protein
MFEVFWRLGHWVQRCAFSEIRSTTLGSLGIDIRESLGVARDLGAWVHSELFF